MDPVFNELEPWNTLVTSGVITPYKWGEITPVTHPFSAIHRRYNSINFCFFAHLLCVEQPGICGNRLKLQTFSCFGTSMPNLAHLVENLGTCGIFSKSPQLHQNLPSKQKTHKKRNGSD